jgi:low temperature requirement protein LtrA
VSDRGRDVEHRVTPVELFFDLVFVFALTQVTAMLAENATWPGLGRAMVVLAVLWWIWVSFTWLTNMVEADDGVALAAMLFATGAIFMAALAVPEAFGRYALLFGVAVVIVRAMHLALSVLTARADRELLAAVLRIAPIGMVAALLILSAAFVPTAWRPPTCLIAVLIGLLAPRIAGMSGLHIRPAHFAERYGLIIIIALGESLVATGVGARGTGLSGGVITAAVLGFAVAVSFWLAYFDFTSIAVQHLIAERSGTQQLSLARDIYTYLHLPMVAAIVLFAYGVKVTLGHVGADLPLIAALGLCGGSALYLLSFVGVRLLVTRTLSRGRTVASIAFLAMLPVATVVPALAALGLVAAVWFALHSYELIWWREARARTRALR